MISNIPRQRYSLRNGYTIVELVVVIAIISMMAALVFANVSSSRAAARDAQRRADVEAIAREIERRYFTDPSSVGPSYPTTNGAGSIGISTVIDEMIAAGQLDTLLSPGNTSGSSSFQSVHPLGRTNTGPQTPTTEEYLYQPIRRDGDLCNYAGAAAGPCVSFKIWYRLESGEILYVESRYQQ